MTGGQKDGFLVATTELYVVGGATWESLSVGLKLKGLSGVTIDNKVIMTGIPGSRSVSFSLFLLGGSNPNLSGSQNHIHEFNMTSKTWFSLGQMKIARTEHAVSVIDF